MTRLFTKQWQLGDRTQDVPNKIKALRSRLHFVESLVFHTRNDFDVEQIYLLTEYYVMQPFKYPLCDPENPWMRRTPPRFIEDDLTPKPVQLNWLYKFSLEHAQFFFPPSLLYRETRSKSWLWVLEAGDIDRLESVYFGKPYWNFLPLEEDLGSHAHELATTTKWIRQVEIPTVVVSRPSDEPELPNQENPVGDPQAKGKVRVENEVRPQSTTKVIRNGTFAPEGEAGFPNQGNTVDDPEVKGTPRGEDEVKPDSTTTIPTIEIATPDELPDQETHISDPEIEDKPRVKDEVCPELAIIAPTNGTSALESKSEPKGEAEPAIEVERGEEEKTDNNGVSGLKGDSEIKKELSQKVKFEDKVKSRGGAELDDTLYDADADTDFESPYISNEDKGDKNVKSEDEVPHDDPAGETGSEDESDAPIPSPFTYASNVGEDGGLVQPFDTSLEVDDQIESEDAVEPAIGVEPKDAAEDIPMPDIEIKSEGGANLNDTAEPNDEVEPEDVAKSEDTVKSVDAVKHDDEVKTEKKATEPREREPWTTRGTVADVGINIVSIDSGDPRPAWSVMSHLWGFSGEPGWGNIYDCSDDDANVN